MDVGYCSYWKCWGLLENAPFLSFIVLIGN